MRSHDMTQGNQSQSDDSIRGNSVQPWESARGTPRVIYESVPADCLVNVVKKGV